MNDPTPIPKGIEPAFPQGSLEYFGAHQMWLAEFNTTFCDKWGNTIARGFGKSPDQAILRCLADASDTFGVHVAVRFDVYRKSYTPFLDPSHEKHRQDFQMALRVNEKHNDPVHRPEGRGATGG